MAELADAHGSGPCGRKAFGVQVPACPSGRFDPKTAILAVFVFIFLAQFLVLPARYLGSEGDDAVYVLASRALLSGRYALGISPGDPPLATTTPGWPFLLAPAAAVSGTNPLGYQLWAGLWLALSCALVWAWARRREGSAAALAAAVLFGLNPLVLSRAGIAMSEFPFLACALGLLLALERGLPAWAAGLWLGAAWLVRPAALPLWAAVPASYWMRGRRRDAVVCLAAGAPLLLLWKAWTAAAGVPVPEGAELAEHLPRAAGALAALAASNLSAAVELWGRTVLPLREAPRALALAAGSLLSVLSAAGWWRRRAVPGWSEAGIFLGGSLLMHAFWPWWYERYLPPLLPFLLAGLLALALDLRGRTGAFLLSGLLVAPAFCAQFPALREAARGRALPEHSAAYAWVRDHTAPQELFLGAFDAREAWYTGRPFLAFTSLPPDSRGPSALRRLRVRWVFWVPGSDLGASRPEDYSWSRALEAYRAELGRPPYRRAFRDEVSGAEVYELPPEGPRAPRAPGRVIK